MDNGDCSKILHLEWRAEVRRSVVRRGIVRFLSLSSVQSAAILLLRPQPILGPIHSSSCGFYCTSSIGNSHRWFSVQWPRSSINFYNPRLLLPRRVPRSSLHLGTSSLIPTCAMFGTTYAGTMVSSVLYGTRETSSPTHLPIHAHCVCSF